jgi:acyl-homoserine-lactone acylase
VNRQVANYRVLALVAGAAVLLGVAGLPAVAAEAKPDDDFRWMHGANYVASYAATDVEMWLHYDHAVIARELGYAKKMRLNCVRVFLQSLVYHHDPKAFLARFEHFLATADANGLKVMPILFDSCFGVSPSLESKHIWVANPGPDRMAPRWWPESDAYAKAVVTAHIGDRRIALWDVMNEPTATHLANTPSGKAEIDAFVARYCKLVKQWDPTHPITVGIATWDNRDVYGIPHIFADSEETAAYAIAQAQCEDMGIQVFDSLRCGVARKAEQFGEAELESDRMMQLWRIPETAERMWQASPPRTKRILQAFCDGLNDYRKAHAEECKTSLEATPVQVLALFRWSDIGPSHGIAQLCANTGLKAPPPKVDFPNQSSTWVIGPSRTASGRPIVFIDPHWPAEGQTSWWEFHVHAGRWQAGGFALPGLPFVGLGYTDGAAWAATAGGADSADVFELRLNPKNPDQYWYDKQWRDLVVRNVTLRVKAASGKVEERHFRMRESVHGPIILEKDGRVIAGAVCGARDTSRIDQWLAMNRSQSAKELRDAFRFDQAPWLNITYGTRDGHFGYIQSGSCPLRGDGPYNMLGVDDGTRSAANWRGRVPFDALPQVHDPASGWLQSCNTAANYVTDGHTLKAEDFPPGVVCGHYFPDGRTWRGRGRRCFEVMPKMQNVTLKEAEALALDTFAPAGPIWAGPLLAAYDAHKQTEPDPDLSMKAMADAVRRWDFHVRKDSVGAAAFRYWRLEYAKLHPEAFGENEAHGAPKSQAEQRDAMKALRAAADYLKKAFGASLVPWGQLLRLRRGGLDLPLDGDVGFFGGIECMRATGTEKPDASGRFIFGGGQVISTVVELTDPIQARSIVPYGQSRRIESRHYADQAHLYSEGRMRPAWHAWSQLRDHVESREIVEYRPKSL